MKTLEDLDALITTTITTHDPRHPALNEADLQAIAVALRLAFQNAGLQVVFPNSIQMPTTESEAMGMYLAGIKWIEENAPHLIKIS